jgi:tetratricopeptide (TPR) repeat protein
VPCNKDATARRKLDEVCYEVRETLRMRVAAFAASLGCLQLALAGVPGLAGLRCWPRGADAQETQIPTLRAAVTAAPTDAEASLALGRTLRRAGHLAEARTELLRASALAGRPELALRIDWELERVAADRRDFGQALAVCAQLAARPGAAAQGHACQAAAQLVRQRATEALSETSLALAKDPRCFEAKLAEGQAYSLELDGPRAEDALRTAISLRVSAVEPFIELGRVLEREGKHDEAVAQLRAAVQLDPSGPDAIVALASVLPPGAESLDLYNRASRERPSFLEAWLALGTQHFAAGRLAETKTAASAALRADASSAGARILLGKVALVEGHPDEAIDAGRAALKIVANSAAATLLVADGEARRGNLDLALEAYQAAWGLDHGDPTPLVHASQACHAAARDTSARAFGIKATQEFPRWGPGWASLGDALAAQNERQAAREAYRKALGGEGLADKASVQSKLAALQ